MPLVENTILTKRNIVGKWGFHVFEKDGITVEVPCTEEEYNALALPNAGQPTKENFVWKFSYRTDKFDTPTGFLSENEYAEYADGTFMVKINGRTGKLVKDSIKENKITKVGVDYASLRKHLE